MHHKKIDKWLQPGGHIEVGDDTLPEAALREVVEETGLEPRLAFPDIFDIDVHVIPEHDGIPEHKHFDIRFLFVANRNSGLKLSNESHNLSWIIFDKLLEYNDEEAFQRFLKKIINFQICA